MNDRIKVLFCPRCPASFRGRDPQRCYDRHLDEHRASQVSAVVSS